MKCRHMPHQIANKPEPSKYILRCSEYRLLYRCIGKNLPWASMVKIGELRILIRLLSMVEAGRVSRQKKPRLRILI